MKFRCFCVGLLERVLVIYSIKYIFKKLLFLTNKFWALAFFIQIYILQNQKKEYVWLLQNCRFLNLTKLNIFNVCHTLVHFQYYEKVGNLICKFDVCFFTTSRGVSETGLFSITHAWPICQNHVTIVCIYAYDVHGSSVIKNTLFLGALLDIALKQTSNCLKSKFPSFYSIQKSVKWTKPWGNSVTPCKLCSSLTVDRSRVTRAPRRPRDVWAGPRAARRGKVCVVKAWLILQTSCMH